VAGPIVELDLLEGPIKRPLFLVQLALPVIGDGDSEKAR